MKPRVAIAVVGAARSGPGWRVRWRVTSEPPVRLTHAAAPHGKFRADDHDLDVTTPTELALDVTSSEPPGSEIENTFLILTAQADGETWRILARMRVRIGDDGLPHPVVERTDVQEVGFDGHG